MILEFALVEMHGRASCEFVPDDWGWSASHPRKKRRFPTRLDSVFLREGRSLQEVEYLRILSSFLDHAAKRLSRSRYWSILCNMVSYIHNLPYLLLEMHDRVIWLARVSTSLEAQPAHVEAEMPL